MNTEFNTKGTIKKSWVNFKVKFSRDTLLTKHKKSVFRNVSQSFAMFISQVDLAMTIKKKRFVMRPYCKVWKVRLRSFIDKTALMSYSLCVFCLSEYPSLPVSLIVSLSICNPSSVFCADYSLFQRSAVQVNHSGRRNTNISWSVRSEWCILLTLICFFSRNVIYTVQSSEWPRPMLVHNRKANSKKFSYLLTQRKLNATTVNTRSKLNKQSNFPIYSYAFVFNDLFHEL